MNCTYITEKIPQKEGGGYRSYIKEIGENSLVGDGETPMESMCNLMKAIKDLFENHADEIDTIKIPKRR